MRKLPLAALGAASALGLFAAAAQAEPVPLTYGQMDQMTAGATVVVAVSQSGSTYSETTTHAESTGDGSASADATANAQFDSELAIDIEAVDD